MKGDTQAFIFQFQHLAKTQNFWIRRSYSDLIVDTLMASIDSTQEQLPDTKQRDKALGGVVRNHVKSFFLFYEIGVGPISSSWSPLSPGFNLSIEYHVSLYCF